MSQVPQPNNRQHQQETKTTMPPVGFETAIPASEWPQTHALTALALGSTCEGPVEYT